MNQKKTFEDISEKEFSAMLEDGMFLDYFNIFLSLPIFAQKVVYHMDDDLCQLDPHANTPDGPVEFVKRSKILNWMYSCRLELFLQSDLFFEYSLCQDLVSTKHHRSSLKGSFHDIRDLDAENAEIRQAIGHVCGMNHLRKYLRLTPGEKLVSLWMDIEKFYRTSTVDEKARWLKYREIQIMFYDLEGSALHTRTEENTCVLIDNQGFIECKTYNPIIGPTMSKQELDRLMLQESSDKPSVTAVEVMKTSHLRNLQKLLSEILIEYWLVKYILHLKTVQSLVSKIGCGSDSICDQILCKMVTEKKEAQSSDLNNLTSVLSMDKIDDTLPLPRSTERLLPSDLNKRCSDANEALIFSPPEMANKFFFTKFKNPLPPIGRNSPESILADLEMNLRSNKDYAKYMVTDRISGGPFEKFLASRKHQEAMSLLNFWNDAQIYLSSKDKIKSNIQDYVKYRRAMVLIMRYLVGPGDKKSQRVLAPSLRYSLQRHLAIGKGEEIMRQAQHFDIEYLKKSLDDYFQEDLIQFDALVIKRFGGNLGERLTGDFDKNTNSSATGLPSDHGKAAGIESKKNLESPGGYSGQLKENMDYPDNSGKQSRGDMGSVEKASRISKKHLEFHEGYGSQLKKNMDYPGKQYGGDMGSKEKASNKSTENTKNGHPHHQYGVDDFHVKSRKYEKARRTELAFQIAADAGSFSLNGLLLNHYPDIEIPIKPDERVGSLKVKKFKIVHRPDLLEEKSLRNEFRSLGNKEKLAREQKKHEEDLNRMYKEHQRGGLKKGFKPFWLPPAPKEATVSFGENEFGGRGDERGTDASGRDRFGGRGFDDDASDMGRRSGRRGPVRGDMSSKSDSQIHASSKNDLDMDDSGKERKNRLNKDGSGDDPKHGSRKNRRSKGGSDDEREHSSHKDRLKRDGSDDDMNRRSRKNRSGKDDSDDDSRHGSHKNRSGSKSGGSDSSLRNTKNRSSKHGEGSDDDSDDDRTKRKSHKDGSDVGGSRKKGHGGKGGGSDSDSSDVGGSRKKGHGGKGGGSDSDSSDVGGSRKKGHGGKGGGSDSDSSDVGGSRKKGHGGKGGGSNSHGSDVGGSRKKGHGGKGGGSDSDSSDVGDSKKKGHGGKGGGSNSHGSNVGGSKKKGHGGKGGGSDSDGSDNGGLRKRSREGKGGGSNINGSDVGDSRKNGRGGKGGGSNINGSDVGDSRKNGRGGKGGGSDSDGSDNGGSRKNGRGGKGGSDRNAGADSHMNPSGKRDKAGDGFGDASGRGNDRSGDKGRCGKLDYVYNNWRKDCCGICRPQTVCCCYVQANDRGDGNIPISENPVSNKNALNSIPSKANISDEGKGGKGKKNGSSSDETKSNLGSDGKQQPCNCCCQTTGNGEKRDSDGTNAKDKIQILTDKDCPHMLFSLEDGVQLYLPQLPSNESSRVVPGIFQMYYELPSTISCGYRPDTAFDVRQFEQLLEHLCARKLDKTIPHLFINGITYVLIYPFEVKKGKGNNKDGKGKKKGKK